MPTLFDPLKLGALTLPNRIIMAPLTRSRATPDTRVPTDLMAEYYVQRAERGADHVRSHPRDAHGRGLCRHAGHLVGRTDRRLEDNHKSGA